MPSTFCPASIATAAWSRLALMVVLPVAVIVPPLSVSLFAAIAMPSGAESVSAYRVAALHRGRVRGGRAGCRFRGAVKVKLQLRAAGDVDRRAEGHVHLDSDAVEVEAVRGRWR